MKAAILVLWMVTGIGVISAQFPERRRGRPEPAPRVSTQINQPYDGTFEFARIRYASTGGGFSRDFPWSHDFPRAEQNFVSILAAVSSVPTRIRGSAVFGFDDPALFDHSVAYIVEVGAWVPSATEITALHRWLTRGGFLIVDDFQGRDMANFETQLARVMPDGKLLPVPAEHPVFDSFYHITAFDQVRHPYNGRQTTYWGLFEDNDPTGRLMLIANWDGDIAEYWEYSDQGFFPIDISNEAYKLGVNYVVYALTR